jgi:hypothetical protein
MATRLLCPSCQRPFRQPTVFPFRCRCGHIFADGNSATLTLTKPKPTGGPGTELKKILDELGFKQKPSCPCAEVQAKMDQWGADGCQEPANLAWIIAQMEANAAKYSWLEKVQVAMSAAASPLAFVINPMDIYGSLVREAIRRAKSKSELPDKHH